MLCPFDRATLLACLLSLLQSPQPAPVTDVERRDFAILVDGKEAGQSQLVITVQNDGTTVVAGTAKVKVNQIIFNYTFSIESTEWWKEGKLIGLRANTVDNGKRLEITAAPDGGNLRLTINGQQRAASAEAWTASFWKLADARYHNKTVPVLEPDSGKEYTGQLQYVGTEQLTLLGQPQSCYHFRVSGGGYPVDVWFDRYHRLVRQEFIDSGHRTIVQLTGIKR